MIFPVTSRRDFLATTSVSAMSALFNLRPSHHQTLLARVGVSPQPANAFLPDPSPIDHLRAMATAAIESAKSAGASFADIRISERQLLELRLGPLSPVMPDTSIQSTYDFGVRVMVDGAWAFVHGTNPTADGTTKGARDAVATARGYARQIRRKIELAPTPVATGEWTTPFQIDPFTVPLEDQAALLGAYRAAAARVRYGSDPGVAFKWLRDTRVFASSEGALTTQIIYRSEPSASVTGNLGLGERGNGPVNVGLPGYLPAAGGYETVTLPGFQDTIKRFAEEAVRIASIPRRTLDVGRYPVVFDGVTLGAAMGATIGPALELDRVLGYEADAAGTSYLSPPNEILGTQITSPLLNLKAHRALPAIWAVKWDDEGVEPDSYDLIRDGVLVDYHTSRETAPALADWYAKQGKPMRSHGCLMAPEVDMPSLVRAPHLAVTPSAKPASVDDLAKELNRGILVSEINGFSTDHQLAGGSMMWGGKLFEVAQGKIVRRIDGNGLQFRTSTFWKSLQTLGDETTVGSSAYNLRKGQPWHAVRHVTSAPAGLFKEIDVVLTKRRI
jgi:TldD protein